MYPPIIRNEISSFRRARPWVSVDFEFPTSSMEPSIIGLSSGAGAHSAYYDGAGREVLDQLEKENVIWLGHNAVPVEREIIQNELGVTIPLERIEDTMIRHYLCNSELCKGVVKDEEEEEPQKNKGQGFMDLWSMASLYTDLPQWKQCRGDHCDGGCRFHDELGYNGIDALAPDIALPKLQLEMKLKQIPEGLYENLKKLTVLCDRMQRQGIKVDRGLVAQLEKEFNEKKDAIFTSRLEQKVGKKGQALKTYETVWDAPFNPRSPKQIVEWFKDHGVPLGSTEKEEVQYAIEHLGERTDPDVREWLTKLYDYKDAGKGLSPWMNERYFGRDGLMHPRFNDTGSSLGRLASSGPNFQNIPRVGWGKKVRAAIVPRDGSLILAKADKSQLELRICLWYAGVPLPKDDAFKWLVEHSEGYFYKVAEDNPNKGWTPRDWAKSVSHGADYMEGVKVLYGRDLDSSRMKKMIEAGAVVVHRDWHFHGGVVAFTGVNLAERLFGSASWENRKKALEIQEAYFNRFKAIREWHRRVSRDAERGYVRSASGRYLTLLGTPEDKLKIGAAFFGQGSGADDVQDAMLRYFDIEATPLLQVHDELVFEFPKDVKDEYLLDFFRIFSAPSTIIPGFQCPVKVSRGPNWLEMTEIGKV